MWRPNLGRLFGATDSPSIVPRPRISSENINFRRNLVGLEVGPPGLAPKSPAVFQHVISMAAKAAVDALLLVPAI